MHPGAELSRRLKQAGATLLAKEGHHETWRLGRKVFRIATKGRRPSGVIANMQGQIRREIQRQKEEEHLNYLEPE